MSAKYEIGKTKDEICDIFFLIDVYLLPGDDGIRNNVLIIL